MSEKEELDAELENIRDRVNCKESAHAHLERAEAFMLVTREGKVLSQCFHIDHGNMEAILLIHCALQGIVHEMHRQGMFKSLYGFDPNLEDE